MKRLTSLFPVLLFTALNCWGQPPEEFYQQGIQAMQEGNTASAIHYFNLAIEADKNFAQAHGALGTLFLETGDFTKAEVHLKQSLTLDPSLSIASLNLAHLYRKSGRIDTAIETYQALIQANPNQV